MKILILLFLFISVFSCYRSDEESITQGKNVSNIDHPMYYKGYGNGYVNTSELIDTVRSGNINSILALTNEIKQMRNQKEIVYVVLDFWNGNVNNYSGISKDVINIPIVRLEFADILRQASGSNDISFDVNTLRPYVLSLTETKDIQILEKVISLLGYIGNPNDLEILLGYTHDEKSIVYKNAVRAIVSSCYDNLPKIVKEMESKASNIELKKYIVSEYEEYSPLREPYCKFKKLHSGK